MDLELSLIMPCLNEAKTVAMCIRKARQGAQAAGVTAYEIIVADNGSEDGSPDIAQAEGATVIHVKTRGYGAALLGATTAARGSFVIMADADDSYDWSDIRPFVEKLRNGYKLVMGSRIKGTILAGAMPPLHRWLGNPILTGLGNLLFGTHISDFHCGMRGFDREAINALHLYTPGMEFATEMVAMAAINHLSIVEVPIVYYPDGRMRRPHLRTWRDGWRHLIFMLLLSPDWVFLYPALLLIGFGLIANVFLLPGAVHVGSVVLDVHTLLIGNVGLIIGIELATLWLISRVFVANNKLIPLSPRLKRVLNSRFIDLGLLMGVVIFLLGTIPIFNSIAIWSQTQFGSLNYEIFMRLLIPGLTLCVIGAQIFFGSFVITLINILSIWGTESSTK